ncbi:MAG: NAD(P)/FAD-dependent oxidoreductase [Bacteroidota bacterium]
MGKVIIVGGGLAGLISSIQLAHAGVACLLIEKKSYPFHRVCGEYISNEAVPFLKRSGLYPADAHLPQIGLFQLSSVRGKQATMPLDLGGFGVSRFFFDSFLYQKASKSGVKFLLNTEVINISFQDDSFLIRTPLAEFEADVVIGAFGKRSRLDVQLDRSFMKARSPYAGIKYHIKTEHPDNLIALHNFEGGYCGISNVEDGRTNLCYLTHRDNLRRFGDIKSMEENVLYKNPLLKNIFKNSQFLFEKPEVINEISFQTKAPVEQHILMAGDAAGMITPLCGNGMAMAIHTAKILSECIVQFQRKEISRQQMENMYAIEWTRNFSARLWAGRKIQALFGNSVTSNIAVNMALYIRPIAETIVRNTHGKVF